MATAPRQPNNLLALLLSLIPGFGHLYLERYIVGALLFAAFVTALNGAFLGYTLHTLDYPETTKWVSLIVLAVVWVWAVGDGYRRSYGTDRLALARRKAKLLREGLLDYLRDELEAAITKLSRAADLDIDEDDPDPVFHLGVACGRFSERLARQGDSSGARRQRRRAQAALRSCQARDSLGKWGQECRAELRRLRRTVTMTGRLQAVDLGESADMLPKLASLAGVPVEGLGEALKDAHGDEEKILEPATRGFDAEDDGSSAGGAALPSLDEDLPELPPRPSRRLRALSGSSVDLPAAPRGEVGAGRRTERTSRRLVAKRLRRLLEDNDSKLAELDSGQGERPIFPKDEVAPPAPPAEDPAGAPPEDSDPPALPPASPPEGLEGAEEPGELEPRPAELSDPRLENEAPDGQDPRLSESGPYPESDSDLPDPDPPSERGDSPRERA